MREAPTNMPEYKDEPAKVKWVDISSFRPAKRGSEIRVVVVLENGEIRFEDKNDGAGIIQNIKEEGVMSPEGKIVTPDDGEDFLNALRYELKHPALRASRVKEGESVEPFESPQMQKPE